MLIVKVRVQATVYFMATSHMRLKACDHCILRPSQQSKRLKPSECTSHYKMKALETRKNYHGWKVYMGSYMTDYVKWTSEYGLWLRVKGPHDCTLTTLGSCAKWSLGPLHTWAKSRDHEVVRAQKKVSNGRPNTPPKSCSVVMDPQV
jgi:hypothetical protein